jgi:tetratricopeptide (TPR) repeat protein
MIQSILAVSSLYIWLPIVVYIFVTRPPQRAVVVAFIFAWLFLPNLAWKFSGIPDYTKSSATIFGVLMCVAFFDLPRLLTLRPRWYDLPVVVNCLCPFAASISVGLGAYDGLSAVLEQTIQWGFPYLIGRMYFADLPGLRQLALGIAIGGLIYTPFCLLEIRLSPQISKWVYGFTHWESVRYGGYRPRVFLSTGLELGMWMTCSTLVAQRLWACGAIKTLGGYSFGKLTLALSVTTVLCKSTGALSLLIVGLGILWMVTRTRSSWPVWLLIAVVPFYTTTRIAGLWSGREILDVAKVLGEDRAQSLEYRLQNEDVLIDHSLKHAVFGGGRKDGTQVYGRNGLSVTVIDGYWIIIFGRSGLIGLSSLVAMMLLPIVLLTRRHPGSTWTRPDVAPAAVLATMLGLIMIDDLSNAMLNPIYALIIGGLSGLPSASRRGRLQEAEASLISAIEMAEAGHLLEAESSFRRAIELASGGEDVLDGLRVRAEALEGLGSALLPADRTEEAEEALREAVAIREAIATDLPEADHERELAIARGRLGRALAQLGRIAEAIAERGRALEHWDRLAIRLPGDPDLRARRADALNDLAWLLAAESDPALLDAPRAVRLADEAVRLDPDREAGWNTLGVARYRAGDWAGAVEALERSVALGPPGGTAFDHFFLAMAFQRLGDEARARDSFGRAVDWSDRHRSGHPDLARFRDEAAALLEKPKPTEVDAF